MKTLLLELTTGEGLCPTAPEGVKLFALITTFPSTTVLEVASKAAGTSGQGAGQMRRDLAT